MAIQACFAKKLTRSEDCNDGFLALLGNNSEFYLALPDVKNSIRDLPLREYNLILAIFAYRFSVAPPPKAERGGSTIAIATPKCMPIVLPPTELKLEQPFSQRGAPDRPLRSPCPFGFRMQG